MGSQEGIEILLDAVRQLRLRNNEVDYKLDLIGDGPERVQLEQYSDNIGLSETCYFHGRISDSSLREFLKDADIAVNPDRPSIFNDLSSMNKIVEYMAFGIPIVQFSSQEGNFTARDAAVSVSEADSSALARAIEDIRIDFDKRKSMSRFGLIRFRELSWETQATKLIGVYERVLRFRLREMSICQRRRLQKWRTT
jgi:glycosyltransferase involved in cell wall biosynthesis